MDFLSINSAFVRAAIALVLGLVLLGLLFITIVGGTVGVVTFFDAIGSLLKRLWSRLFRSARGH